MIALTVLAVFVIAGAVYLSVSFRKMKNMPEVAKSDKIVDLTDKNFQYQVKGKLVLVDFWASWCVPCKMMAPVLNDLAEEISGQVKVCKVNVDEYQSLASKYNIRGIPTMVLLRDGREIDRFVGAKTKQFLLDKINRAN